MIAMMEAGDIQTMHKKSKKDLSMNLLFSMIPKDPILRMFGSIQVFVIRKSSALFMKRLVVIVIVY